MKAVLYIGMDCCWMGGGRFQRVEREERHAPAHKRQRLQLTDVEPFHMTAKVRELATSLRGQGGASGCRTCHTCLSLTAAHSRRKVVVNQEMRLLVVVWMSNRRSRRLVALLAGGAARLVVAGRRLIDKGASAAA
jgi:hypothetical protein